MHGTVVAACHDEIQAAPSAPSRSPLFLSNHQRYLTGRPVTRKKYLLPAPIPLRTPHPHGRDADHCAPSRVLGTYSLRSLLPPSAVVVVDAGDWREISTTMGPNCPCNCTSLPGHSVPVTTSSEQYCNNGHEKESTTRPALPLASEEGKEGAAYGLRTARSATSLRWLDIARISRAPADV